jgi:cytochrome P450
MTEPLPDARLLPIDRRPERPFDPPGGLAQLREQHPVSRLAFPDGHVGWLVSSHALARSVLADPRFSSRYDLMHHPFADFRDAELPPVLPGYFLTLDPPAHTRYRRLLTGKFTVRRMAQLTSRVEQITASHLDAMAQHGPPTDLVQAFAYPIPALTICALLGVPNADHELFQRLATVNARDTPIEEVIAAVTALRDYVRDLVAAKRAQPTDDLLSELTTTDLSQEELEGVGTVLLASGLDTTANMLALGAYALLRHPDQLAALRADPDITDNAVEELLRYLSVLHTAGRAALDDVELDGQPVKAGETVTLAINSANRDPERFPDPDTLDLKRRAVGHLAFGHGIHQCLGQQLARVELRAALPALVARFPTLRLAAGPSEIPLRTGSIYGVQQLPVTWDRA